MTRIERGQKMALLTVTTDDSGLHAADLVIEAVFEDLAVKHQVLREVESKGKPGVIFASNTSSIPICEDRRPRRRTPKTWWECTISAPSTRCRCWR